MRLLDARALIHEGVARLVDDVEVGHPQYAILSHRWSSEEVLFEDIKLGPSFEIAAEPTKLDLRAKGYSLRSRREFRDVSTERPIGVAIPDGKREGVCDECRAHCRRSEDPNRSHVKLGWTKLCNACLQACRDHLDYIWINNCCINKESSAELSEAINAMFKWYQDADVCYVHLQDCNWCPHLHVSPDACIGDCRINTCTRTQVIDCRWLTRGWTLQELIAPLKLIFLDRNWIRTCCQDITSTICDAAGIPTELVQTFYTLEDGVSRNAIRLWKDSRFSDSTIAQRMSWASGRHTTREEDRAYSLLGLFSVKMPLIYGEGKRAFERLQKALLEGSDVDDSIFAWEERASKSPRQNLCLLARSPDGFACWRKGASHFKITRRRSMAKCIRRNAFEANGQGLRVRLPVVDSREGDEKCPKQGNLDSRLRYSLGYAILTDQLESRDFKVPKHLALKLRNWMRDGEYVFSEIMLSAHGSELEQRTSWSHGKSDCPRSSRRRLFASESKIDRSRLRDLFILWKPLAPIEDYCEQANLGWLYTP